MDWAGCGGCGRGSWRWNWSAARAAKRGQYVHRSTWRRWDEFRKADTGILPLQKLFSGAAKSLIPLIRDRQRWREMGFGVELRGAQLYCERHRPEQARLRPLVQHPTASFIARTATSAGSALPRFVKDEFDDFLSAASLEAVSRGRAVARAATTS